MTAPLFDRTKLKVFALARRKNLLSALKVMI